MKKRYFFIIALIIGLGLNFMPRFMWFDSDETTWMVEVPGAVVMQEYGEGSDRSACAYMGRLAGYDFSGVPFVSYIPGGICGSHRVVYPLAIVLNFALAAVVAVILYLGVNRIKNIRRKA